MGKKTAVIKSHNDIAQKLEASLTQLFALEEKLFESIRKVNYESRRHSK